KRKERMRKCPAHRKQSRKVRDQAPLPALDQEHLWAVRCLDQVALSDPTRKGDVRCLNAAVGIQVHLQILGQIAAFALDGYRELVDTMFLLRRELARGDLPEGDSSEISFYEQVLELGHECTPLVECELRGFALKKLGDQLG